VQQARNTVAQRLLKQRALPIGDVGRALGYSDPAHFTRAFQRWTGVTPRDFRRHEPKPVRPAKGVTRRKGDRLAE
jgi:AraC-like DNA-binding protein